VKWATRSPPRWNRAVFRKKPIGKILIAVVPIPTSGWTFATVFAKILRLRNKEAGMKRLTRILLGLIVAASIFFVIDAQKRSREAQAAGEMDQKQSPGNARPIYRPHKHRALAHEFKAARTLSDEELREIDWRAQKAQKESEAQNFVESLKSSSE
jgi:hypothetical protein